MLQSAPFPQKWGAYRVGRRRRGDHHAVQLRRIRQLHALRARGAGVRRHRRDDDEPGSGPRGSGRYRTNASGAAGSCLRAAVRDDRARRALPRAQSSSARGCLRGGRGRVWRAQDRHLRQGDGLLVLSQQADHHGGRRFRHDQRSGMGKSPAQPAQSGPQRDADLALP